eukprot:g24705.t1
MDRLCQDKEAGMRGRVGHGMRLGDGGEILKLVKSTFRPSGCRLPRRNMRCCSSSLRVVPLAQVLCKAVSEPPLGLTDVEEATSEAADTIDHIDGCASVPLSDVKGLFGALNESKGEGVGA